MMIEKVIKTEEEYQAALSDLELLMDAEPGSKEEGQLELLSVLIEKYEYEHYPMPLPDPVDAIKFRMEQQGLTQKDLIPFIGSQSKVSEILNRKLPLSLSMIRNLHEGLGIPAEVLIQEAGATLPQKQYDRRDFPFNEMANRGYFSAYAGNLNQAKQHAEECLEQLFSVFKGKAQSLALCRSSEGEADQNALLAWQAQVLTRANQQECQAFDRSKVTIDTIKQVVKLSAYTTGPLKARDALAGLGIPLVTLKHLPHTYLDGACFLSPDGRPVIGMTLRHDRQDNFWFTLMHELAHVVLHLLEGVDAVFMDNTEHSHPDCDDLERQANQLAAEWLIPPQVWEAEHARLMQTTDSATISQAAEKIGVCPALVAGRIRHELKDFSLFSNLLGSGEVRSLFEEMNG
ncbi:MAG: ImmA/IrrE family metallo-endopeptidase [Anaerolineae bacterium]|nr:ImmA/IrrE family metallo-endopeptidase [Anaerolineae bacterium]